MQWLDQGWTEDQRRRFHHQSQGTLTLPVPRSWFLALQQPEDFRATAGLISDPAYLDRFGFIATPQGLTTNPDNLPVGFARTTGTDPRTGRSIDAIGFTCAACHTGRIDYQGTSLLIDGGPALIDLTAFGKQLALALGETALSPTRFRRFANRVLGPGNSFAARLRLHREMTKVIAAGLGDILQTQSSANVQEGFGRLDALNRIGNTVFAGGLGLPRNNVPITAPVAYPHIWDVSWFSWVQYNGSIEQPMVRNAGEAMGVGALINFKDGPTPVFTSTIPIGDLHQAIETSLAGAQPPLPAGRFSGLRSPSWPEDVLPAIDRARAAQGADIYRQRCQSCHLPGTDTPEFWTDASWLPVNAAGERYLDLKMIPISAVGTDPAQAQNMRDRTVLIPTKLGIPAALRPASAGYQVHSYGPALGYVVERVVNRWYDGQTPPITTDDRRRMNGHRLNGIRAPLAYKARPLNGIWATPPYLHNGSVPTLWDLLSPYDERNARPVFRLGSRQFDPVKVGYVDAGGFALDTRLAGNRNTGHLFETPADPSRARPGTIGPFLSPDERRALIEYLKTL